MQVSECPVENHPRFGLRTKDETSEILQRKETESHSLVDGVKIG